MYARIALSTCYTLGFVCLLVQLVIVYALVPVNLARTYTRTSTCGSFSAIPEHEERSTG